MKRLIDLVIASTSLLLLSPIIAIIAVVIRMNMGSPVLFRQIRPGYMQKPFTLLKFRTMRMAIDPDGKDLPDSKRLTTLGRFLRKTSLDELPQLWNVFRGDISLVGPRPLLERYIPYFNERELLRFSVKPGITGWAQIHGRNEASWDKRLENDVWYVGHWSLGLDLKILVLTVKKVLSGKGVVVDAQSEMLDLDEERGESRHKTISEKFVIHEECDGNKIGSC
jgi:lipopolysaccharide/colanic/teichoic acid biosynthesis glycosyltransferase